MVHQVTTQKLIKIEVNWRKDVLNDDKQKIIQLTYREGKHSKHVCANDYGLARRRPHIRRAKFDQSIQLHHMLRALPLLDGVFHSLRLEHDCQVTKRRHAPSLRTFCRCLGLYSGQIEVKKIIAQTQEDLRVISALCSEAKIKQSEIKFLKENKIFLLSLERENKEKIDSKDKINSILKFEFIEKSKSKNIDQNSFYIVVF